MKLKKIVLFMLLGIAVTGCAVGCADTKKEQAQQTSGQVTAQPPAEVGKAPQSPPDPDEPKK